MRPISLTNATRFALWLAANHPAAFRKIAWQLTQAPASRGSLGRFGDDSGLQSLVVDPATLSLPSSDLSTWVDSSPALQSVTVSDISPIEELSNAFDPAAVAASGSDSGFWSTLGSGLSSAASGTGSVIASVARSLTNPATLAGAAGLASTLIQANAQTQVANAQQQAVLATQLARVQQNASPAPIQYTTSPTGQRIPVLYNSATGQYEPVTRPVLSSLSSSSSLPGWLPWILGGGVVIALLLAS